MEGLHPLSEKNTLLNNKICMSTEVIVTLERIHTDIQYVLHIIYVLVN